MATESFVQVATDGSGKKLDTFTITQPDGSTVAHREAVVNADPTLTGGLQSVALTGEAMTEDSEVAILLGEVLVELRLHSQILATALGYRGDVFRERDEVRNSVDFELTK